MGINGSSFCTILILFFLRFVGDNLFFGLFAMALSLSVVNGMYDGTLNDAIGGMLSGMVGGMKGA